jgi:hypothetical protein
MAITRMMSTGWFRSFMPRDGNLVHEHVVDIHGELAHRHRDQGVGKDDRPSESGEQEVRGRDERVGEEQLVVDDG